MKINYGLKNIVTTTNVKLYKEVKVRFCYDYEEFNKGMSKTTFVKDVKLRLENNDHKIEEPYIGKITNIMDDLVNVTFELENGMKVGATFCIGYQSLYELEYV